MGIGKGIAVAAVAAIQTTRRLVVFILRLQVERILSVV